MKTFKYITLIVGFVALMLLFKTFTIAVLECIPFVDGRFAAGIICGLVINWGVDNIL